MAGGITFGAAKASLALVCDNGVSPTDPRVMRRTNEATQEILAEMIPVGGMMEANIVLTGTGTLLLPPEMESAIVAEIITPGATVNGRGITEGLYDIVNPFTYVDPSMAYDNPLIDQYLVPVAGDPTRLQRKYFYPGVDNPAGVIVTVTGPKSYQPITKDSDYLICQNVPALKLMIQAIERRENGPIDDARKYRADCLEYLTAEVRKHQLDPRRMMKRKADYEADLSTFGRGTLGWMRAWLALTLPGLQMVGKETIARMINDAIREILAEMIPVNGMMEADVALGTAGILLLPPEMESAIVADILATDVTVNGRAITEGWYNIVNPFTYVDPSMAYDNPLIDQYLVPTAADPKVFQRKYLYPNVAPAPGTIVRVTGPKSFQPARLSTSYLIVQNETALKLMVEALGFREKGDFDNGTKYRALAFDNLQAEVKKHMVDPRRMMKRKADYEHDLDALARGTLGWTRAWLALTLPDLQTVGKETITRMINDATQEILSEIIPVGGMMEADVALADGGFLLLPPEMESVIAFEIIKDPLARVNGEDIAQGWFSIVNPFTYIDPTQIYDNPLIDKYMVPTAADPKIFQRKYFYPNVIGNAIVRVTGPKSFQLILDAAQFLIVQNVAALKLMVQSIGFREKGDNDNSAKFRGEAINLLQAEVKKHLLDPQRHAARKAQYEADLSKLPQGTMGWTRAWLALTVPEGGLNIGKEELTRLLLMAEQRLLGYGIWKGCLKEFDVCVCEDRIIMPEQVEGILAANMNGEAIQLRSIFFKYLENGPGEWDYSCAGLLSDEGDVVMSDGVRRRQYRMMKGSGGCCTSSLKAVCKVRFVLKKTGDQMVIYNTEALRLEMNAIALERQEKYDEAAKASASAKNKLSTELEEYLAGIKHTVPFTDDAIWSMSDLGTPL